MSKNKLKLIFLLMLVVLISACTKVEEQPQPKNNEKESVNNQHFFLNSILTLNIYDTDVDEEKISEQVKERVQELEDKLTLLSPESEVSKINEKSGIEPVKVSDDTFYIIQSSLKYSELSKGKFDVSVGDLVQLWGIDTEHEKIPTEEEIKASLEKIDYKKIILDEKEKTVFLQEKGMVIDLGAIAKGYVADVINEILKENNVKSAIVNLGGNVYAYGNKNGDDFKVGIRDPYSTDANSYLGILHCQDKTVVTSGVYERFFEKDGQRYHHILSTETGYPIDNGLVSTTIITKNSMDADALSTTTFAMGLQEGLNLIEQMEGVDAIFITNDKQIYTTSGIKDKFEIKDDIYIKAN